MSEYIDIYIDTTTKVPEDATEFDYELFGRFMSGGPWVAHSEYMKLKDDNAELRELVNVMAYCMQQGRDCDGCAVNGADGVVTAPSGCDWLRDRMRELGVVE